MTICEDGLAAEMCGSRQETTAIAIAFIVASKVDGRGRRSVMTALSERQTPMSRLPFILDSFYHGFQRALCC
jgi:hypothetical protein